VAEQGGEEKTEKATPKKLKDARKEGNIFQSKEVAIAISTIAIFSVLRIYMTTIYGNIVSLFQNSFSYMSTVDEITAETVSNVLLNGFYIMLACTLPIMLIAMVIGILAYGVQTRFLFTMKKLQPKFSKLNPLSGIKNIFSMKSLFEVVKSLIKMVIIIAVIYSQFMGLLEQSLTLMSADLLSAIAIVFDSIYSLGLKLSLAFIVIAVVDFFYQRYDYDKRMKMTKKEVKEEFKQTEGDPQIKGRIRQQQRRMSQARMMQRIPEADVIVRNPTHFAVALAYDPKVSKAPVVVAKGQDFVAARIIEEADKYDIPMIENKPLARSLYKTIPLESEISPEFYTAIAEVLAWVHSLGKLKALQEK